MILILFLDIYFIIGYIFLLLNISLVFLYLFNRKHERTYKLDHDFHPTVSLIVPAHNEEDVIERTIHSFLNTDYDPLLKEMIIVDDGSSDATEKIARRYAYTVIENDITTYNNQKYEFRNITLIKRGVGGNGKALASNRGAREARGEIFFFIDADVQVSEDIFLQAVKHLGDKKVGALSGYVEIAENKSLLNGFICFESLLAQKVMRAGFNLLGVQYVVPGGCAIFRKEIWNKVGGYSTGSLAEDTDLTWKVLTETDQEIRFDGSIRVLADEPQILMSLWNQRVRWARGNMEITKKHWYKVGHRKYGKGMVHLFPYWLASTLMPFVFLFNALATLLALYFKTNLSILATLNALLGFSFFISYFAGLIVGKGKAVFPGLFSPGLPLLTVLISSVFGPRGVENFFASLGIHIGIQTLSLVLIFSILLSIPLTYVMLKLSKKHEIAAEIIQLFILGYWSFVMASSIHGYVLEIMGKKRQWIRTVR